MKILLIKNTILSCYETAECIQKYFKKTVLPQSLYSKQYIHEFNRNIVIQHYNPYFLKLLLYIINVNIKQNLLLYGHIIYNQLNNITKN